jgi:hypothetical protein
MDVYKLSHNSESSGSHGGEYEVALWAVASCSLIEVGRRFRAAYCLRHQGDDLR